MDTEGDDKLECTICSRIYHDPRILACGHTFCCKCIRQLIKHSGDKREVQCPFRCKTKTRLPNGVKHLPPNFALKAVCDEGRSVSDISDEQYSSEEEVNRPAPRPRPRINRVPDAERRLRAGQHHRHLSRSPRRDETFTRHRSPSPDSDLSTRGRARSPDDYMSPTDTYLDDHRDEQSSRRHRVKQFSSGARSPPPPLSKNPPPVPAPRRREPPNRPNSPVSVSKEKTQPVKVQNDRSNHRPQSGRARDESKQTRRKYVPRQKLDNPYNEPLDDKKFPVVEINNNKSPQRRKKKGLKRDPFARQESDENIQQPSREKSVSKRSQPYRLRGHRGRLDIGAVPDMGNFRAPSYRRRKGSASSEERPEDWPLTVGQYMEEKRPKSVERDSTPEDQPKVLSPLNVKRPQSPMESRPSTSRGRGHRPNSARPQRQDVIESNHRSSTARSPRVPVPAPRHRPLTAVGLKQIISRVDRYNDRYDSNQQLADDNVANGETREYSADSDYSSEQEASQNDDYGRGGYTEPYPEREDSYIDF